MTHQHPRHLLVNIDEETDDRLRELAHDRELTIAALVRTALKLALAHWDAQLPPPGGR